MQKIFYNFIPMEINSKVVLTAQSLVSTTCRTGAVIWGGGWYFAFACGPSLYMLCKGMDLGVGGG